MVLADILNSNSYDMKFTLENHGKFSDIPPTLGFKLQWDPAIAKIIRYKFFKISISTKLLILTLTSMWGGLKGPTK